MCSRCRSRLLILVAIAATGLGLHDPAHSPSTQPSSPGKRVLRVAADPNNLPFSNDRGEGFENKLAELVARELGAELHYVWHAQRRGFCRETLKAGHADLVIGLPSEFELALTTKPYYRSTYVFVRRADDTKTPRVSSFDDEALRRVKVGVQLIGDDGANTPPAHSLGRRGIIDNVRGFTVYGDYRKPNPPAQIVQAVADGEVDIAVVWGPLAGFFAKRQAGKLELTPVERGDGPALPVTFEISMGVAHKNKALRDEVNGVIARNRAQIDKILEEYGVPRVAAAPPGEAPRRSDGEDDEDDD